MKKGKILVVDDEVNITQILEFSIGSEGYEVITALNGEEAVDKARREQPDLIILDIMMPKIDGYEACRILKANPLTKNIPVVLLTAKGRDIDKRLGFEVGATDYIVKPFSPNKLVDRIHSLLSCHKK
jgi:DNA-binding response OmpR family regulator